MYISMNTFYFLFMEVMNKYYRLYVCILGVSRWIVKVGEGLLFAVFVFLIIFQFCYFYMYHAWENKSNADRVNAELAGRAMGQVRVLVFLKILNILIASFLKF